MRGTVVLLLGVALAACAGKPPEGRPDPRDQELKVPALEYRSVFEDYRGFADQDLADWRKANEEVGAAGGHAGHRPGQGPGAQTSKPQPGKPQDSGAHHQ